MEPYDDSDIPEVTRAISPTTEVVTLNCPTCDALNEVKAADYMLTKDGRFIISQIATFGCNCAKCGNEFSFRPLPLPEPAVDPDAIAALMRFHRKIGPGLKTAPKTYPQAKTNRKRGGLR